MTSLSKKIGWRATLINKAILCGRATDWPGALKEVFSSHSHSRCYPPSFLVESEGGFGLYQVGASKVWFPLIFDPSYLGLCYHEVFEQGVYENGLCRILPGDWVVDAGACEGFFTLYALEKGANVLAFEPVPEIAQALEKTLRAYIDVGRAKVFPIGLDSERGERMIFIHPTNSGSATLSQAFRGGLNSDYRASQIKEVTIETLDRIVSDLGLSISFLKADVEGSERGLLLGARKTIRWHKPRLSICTYHLSDDWLEIPRVVQRFGVKYHMRFSRLFDYLYGW